jgi:hypothetical protein
LPPQARAAPHFVAHEPPQSTSDSVPFFTLSVQVGAWHLSSVQNNPQLWLAQTPLAQSLAAPQSLPLPHLLHWAPPQSTSVSPLFRCPSSQRQPHWLVSISPHS